MRLDTTMRQAEAAQLAAAGIAGATAPELLGPMGWLWVLAAMGICTLADIMVPPGAGRATVAARYVASVAVTLAASYTASAAVEIYLPEWRGHVWAARFGAVVMAGIVLHPLIAATPRLLAELWSAVLDRVRGGGAARS